MQYKELGEKLVVSQLGFGGIPILEGGLDIMPRHFNPTLSDAIELLHKAYDSGISFFDTAIEDEYGDSEAKIAAAFRTKWDSVVVSSKARAYTRESMEASIRGSIERMQVPYIHLYGIHQVSPENVDISLDPKRGALRALLDAREQGKIRGIALGTHHAAVAAEASKLDCISMVQLPCNPLEYGLFDTACEKGLVLEKAVFHKVYGAGILPALIPTATLLSFAFARSPVAVLVGIGTERELEQLLSDYQKSATVDPQPAPLPHSECNRCQKCICPEGINIPKILRYRAYALLGFHRWAAHGFEKNYTVQCTQCGACLSTCPREVRIPELIAQAEAWFADLAAYNERPVSVLQKAGRLNPPERHPRVGVGAVVLNDATEVLLLLRRKAPERGCWTIPGGAVEFGETIEDAIIREVQEEIGVRCGITKMLGITNHILPGEGTHWVAPAFLVRILSGTPRNMEPDSHTRMEWFPIDSLPSNSTMTTTEALRRLSLHLSKPLWTQLAPRP